VKGNDMTDEELARPVIMRDDDPPRTGPSKFEDLMWMLIGSGLVLWALAWISIWVFS